MKVALYLVFLVSFLLQGMVYGASKTTLKLNESVDLLHKNSQGEITELEELRRGTVIRFRTDSATTEFFRHILILESPNLDSEEVKSINREKLFISKNVLHKGEVIVDLRQGCEAVGTCGRTNNRNYFSDNKSPRRDFDESGGCDGNLSCPRDMKPVCSSAYKIKVCMDVELKAMDRDSSTPEGNHTFYSCQSYCQSMGKRLPTNNEWLVASTGTVSSSCLPRSIEDRPNYRSSSEMKDLRFNQRNIPKNRRNCISSYGIKDMVGVLGQWVTHGHSSSGKGQFNGGLWTQPASSIVYRTVAHGKGYSDYSIGCRCAEDL